MQVDDLLDVGQSESEALDVVLVAGMYAVELVEDLTQVFFLDALSGVADGEAQVVVLVVPGADVDVDGFVVLTLLHGVVHEVCDGVLEVYLVDVDG